MDGVGQELWQCVNKHDTVREVPAVVGASCLPTYKIWKGLNVIYVATQKKDDNINVIGDSDVLGVNIKLISMAGLRCENILMPVNNQTGRSLTDRCVCLGCVTEVAGRAERQGGNIAQEVIKELSCPVLMTTKAQDVLGRQQ